MFPAELLADPAADVTVDALATHLIEVHRDVAAERRADRREWTAGRRAQDSRLLDEVLAEFPEPGDLLALRARFDSWGEVNVTVQVSVPVLAAAYLKASGTSAAEALTLGLSLLVSGTPVELVETLAGPTADGAAKRAAGTKPHWKTEDALDVHAEAMWRHWRAWAHERGPDPESGAHPLAHVAWRALAVAWLETEAGR